MPPGNIQLSPRWKVLFPFKVAWNRSSIVLHFCSSVHDSFCSAGHIAFQVHLQKRWKTQMWVTYVVTHHVNQCISVTHDADSVDEMSKWFSTICWFLKVLVTPWPFAWLLLYCSLSMSQFPTLTWLLLSFHVSPGVRYLNIKILQIFYVYSQIDVNRIWASTGEA